jgi:hypothetical protein
MAEWPSVSVHPLRDILMVSAPEDSNRRSSNGTAEHKPKRTKLARGDPAQRPDSLLGVGRPLTITRGTQRRPSVDVLYADDDESTTICSDTPTGIDELVCYPTNQLVSDRPIDRVQYRDDIGECDLGFVQLLCGTSDGMPDVVQPTFGKIPLNQRAAIGYQTQSASSADTTLTSSGDDNAAVDTTTVKEDWCDEKFCNHDPPSFLEDSAIALLRAKVKDLVPIAAPTLELKRFDICKWVHEQCQVRHAPVTTAFITMQLFDSALNKFGFGTALLLVSSLSVALKHDQRNCSICASECALLATQHCLNSQKRTFSSKDVIEMELAVLFETRFTFLLTPIAAAEHWATVIGFDCRIGDASTEAGAKMQRTFLNLVAMDAVPPNLPAGALGGAVVLAELYRTCPASDSDTDERVELLLQKMAQLYSRRERENATAMHIAAEHCATFEQPRYAPLPQQPQTCALLGGCAVS